MLPELTLEKGARFVEVPIGAVTPNPHQPRKTFDEAGLAELAESIKQHGLIQPITVRARGDRYELVAGERRLRACKLAGHCTIAAMLIDAESEDSAVMALIENLQREDLHFIDEAEGYRRLISEFDITQEEMAQKIGKSQAAVANKLRVLRLEPDVLELLREKGLTERHARALLRLSAVEEQIKVIDVICREGLNVRETDTFVARGARAAKAGMEIEPGGRLPQRVFKDCRIFVNMINQAVEMMRQAGIPPVSEKKESEEYIEFHIIVPKKAGEVKADSE